MSLQAVDEVFKTSKKDSSADDEVEVITDSRDRTMWDGSEEREDHNQVKHHLCCLFKESGQMWGSGKLFPWKQMLRHLASSELILVNWLEGVMFLGEEHASHTMPKGISDLIYIFDLFHGTKVKRKAITISVNSSDEVNLPTDIDENPLEKKSCGTNPLKCNLAQVVTASTQPKKKWLSVIKISSDSTPASESEYRLKEESETKGSDDEDQESYAGSVNSEYKQPSSSSKCRAKATVSSWKLKIITADDSGDQLPLIKKVKGKQPAQHTMAAGQERDSLHAPCIISDMSSTLPMCPGLNVHVLVLPLSSNLSRLEFDSSALMPPHRYAFRVFWVAQQLHFGSFRATAYAAHCSIHLALLPICLDSFAIVLAFPFTLDNSKPLADLVLASQPSSLT
ncbi:hypothetical protein EDD17DRAFT_1763229 [Pisolithus thermaeus]|nr:hypothetical protein EDD17DRAFT_1763229 [Pisolithus thermaeus]